MSKTNLFYPVILAGGSGTRLWPLSTRDHPKQFMKLGQGPSLITQTMLRFSDLCPAERFWVVCGKQHEVQVQEHLPQIPKRQILVEPMARNTAPALAWAAFQLVWQDPEAIMVVLPADHFIPKESWKAFIQDIGLAARVAVNREALVTLGIRPSHADTGFGYLEQGESFQEEGEEYFSVKAFHEKPEGATAQAYLESGRYFWNSGMFVWQAKTFLRALEIHQPKMFQAFSELKEHFGKSDFSQVLQETFSHLESISVDYAIMEQAAKVYMIPAQFDWDDVGSLAALGKLIAGKKEEGASANQIAGEVFSLGSKNNIAIAKTKPLALIGVEDLIVVETPHAVLVVAKERAQEVKQLVELLKKEGREDLI